MRKIVDENGSDGTVRVSAANLNARGVTIVFGCGEGDALMTPWQTRLSCDMLAKSSPEQIAGYAVNA